MRVITDDKNSQAIRNLCTQLGIPIIAELPFDRQFVESQLKCESIMTYAPESTCAEILKKAYLQICNI